MASIKFTANDTFPTTLTFTDNGVAQVMTGYNVDLEIAYPTALVKHHDPATSSPSTGVFKLAWADKELQAGDWQAKIVVTDDLGKIISSDFITINVDNDITPSI